MPTLLTNPKMPAPLRARIEASLGRERPGAAVLGRRFLVFLRVALVTCIVAALFGIIALRHERNAALSRSRNALLDRVRAQRGGLTDQDLGAVSRIETWFRSLSGPYEGDLVAGELRLPGALTAALAQSSVYVRGPVEAFKSSSGTAELASTSFKDAFLLCLLDPPAERTEKAMLVKVHAAYGGGARFEESTRDVHRLYAAAMGLPLLAPAFADRVRAAEGLDQLQRLELELSKAPIEEAKRAAGARLLLMVMDEPNESKNGLSEIDGEGPHPVRVALVDTSRKLVLLRVRKAVDPSWISVGLRSRYASGLDGCGLARDVRDLVERPDHEQPIELPQLRHL